MPFDATYSHSNPRTRKMSDADAWEAARLYDEGWSTADLAARYGVTSPAISYRLASRTVLYRDRTPEQRAALSARRRAHRATTAA